MRCGLIHSRSCLLVNQSLVTDPTISQPGCHLCHQMWCVMHQLRPLCCKFTWSLAAQLWDVTHGEHCPAFWWWVCKNAVNWLEQRLMKAFITKNKLQTWCPCQNQFSLTAKRNLCSASGTWTECHRDFSVSRHMTASLIKGSTYAVMAMTTSCMA